MLNPQTMMNHHNYLAMFDKIVYRNYFIYVQHIKMFMNGQHMCECGALDKKKKTIYCMRAWRHKDIEILSTLTLPNDEVSECFLNVPNRNFENVEVRHFETTQY